MFTVTYPSNHSVGGRSWVACADLTAAINLLRTGLAERLVVGRTVRWVLRAPAGLTVRGDISVHLTDVDVRAVAADHVALVRRVLAGGTASESTDRAEGDPDGDG